jgi:hypothetical protein
MSSHISTLELGHHHEVSDDVLAQRLKDATESLGYWRRQTVFGESPLHRTRAAGLAALWSDQVSKIEREKRSRVRLAAI